jgi:hypothetical protein
MAFERLNRVGLAHFRECAICKYEENRPHSLHHDADDGMHSLSPRLWRGVGHRKNTTAMSAITATAVTTLTGHIPAEADPITVTTIIPVTTITLSMTTTRKAVPPNIKRIIRTKNIRSITMMIRSSAEKLPEGSRRHQRCRPLPLFAGVLFIWRRPDFLI